MNKKLVFIFGLVAVVVISLAGYTGMATSAPPTPISTPNTVAVTRCDVEQTVTVPGKVVNVNLAEVKMPITGKLSQVYVRAGDVVRAGQVLAELDAVAKTEAQLKLIEAQEALEKAQKVITDSGVSETRQIVYITSAEPFQVPVAGPTSGIEESFQVQIIEGEPALGISTQQDVVFFGQESVGVVMPADVSMFGLLDSNADVLTRRSSQVVEQPMTDQDGNLLGKVILSDGPTYGDEILNNVMNGWIAASFVAVLLAAFAGWLVSNRITTPLTDLTRVTSRMASGDLTARADVRGKDEIGMLGFSFNEMAERVEEIVGTLRSFVADAAHELHSPLTAFQTNLELAGDEKNASARTLYLSRAGTGSAARSDGKEPA